MKKLTSFTLAGPIGADALEVSISCVVEAAKPAGLHVTGAALSPTQAKEIAVRVRSAILSTDLCVWPSTGRVTVTLESSAIKLHASALDLPIALAVAGVDVSGLLVIGELGLDGSVRAVRGTIQAALLAKSLGLRGVLVPAQNAREALEALEGESVRVHAISHLSDLEAALASPASLSLQSERSRPVPDFSEVRGHAETIAVVEQSVRSRVGLLLSGPPGTGKTMIARRIPGVLPRMQRDEQLDVTRIYSAIGLSSGLVTERPFRAPHHTISTAALTGGGQLPRPGEVHLAAHGVLFLDELTEFTQGALEALARALGDMPASSRPLVVASVNPCPCGWQGSTVRTCGCSKDSLTRHTKRVDWAAKKLGMTVHASVRSMSLEEMRSTTAAPGESTAVIAGRIASALA